MSWRETLGAANSADCAGSAYGNSKRERRETACLDRVGGVLHTNYGRGYVHQDGRIDDGAPEPMPRPAERWPSDMTHLLRRVTAYYEWPDADRREFIQWARRSPEGLADAKTFLEAEAAKIPAPGMADRRREVLDRLQADPDLHYAWVLDDRAGTDPVVLTLAVRGQGTCDLAIPRAKFNPLALPMLIDRLVAAAREATR